jgi:hypothetical protein
MPSLWSTSLDLVSIVSHRLFACQRRMAHFHPRQMADVEGARVHVQGCVWDRRMVVRPAAFCGGGAV